MVVEERSAQFCWEANLRHAGNCFKLCRRGAGLQMFRNIQKFRKEILI